MALSYTQNLEDYQLSVAFEGQPQGFYIDVGGGHPVSDNVSLWFYERGWRGIIVEPQAQLAALYPLVRPRDVCVKALVGRQDGETDFHVFDRFHGLSTIVKDHALLAEGLGEKHRTIRMPVLTMATLCERHNVNEIDFLKADVEGAEIDVLKGNDWERFRPKVIVLEAITPGTGQPAWDVFEPYLLSKGYSFALFDTLNRFYVARERPEMLARFAGGRADWGAAQHMYEIGRAPENTNHPDHVLASELARGLWASLPHLPARLLAELMFRGRGISPDAAEMAAMKAFLQSEEGRISLGRIACGYDGGQIPEN